MLNETLREMLVSQASFLTRDSKKIPPTEPQEEFYSANFYFNLAFNRRLGRDL